MPKQRERAARWQAIRWQRRQAVLRPLAVTVSGCERSGSFRPSKVPEYQQNREIQDFAIRKKGNPGLLANSYHKRADVLPTKKRHTVVYG